jgi:PhnB protein
MPIINPHIHFNGNTEDAFEFYQSTIGGELRGIMRFRDLQTEGFSFPEDELNKIMHISLMLDEVVFLTGSDVPSILGVVNESENRSKIRLRASSREEADALFAGLSVGGEVEFPQGDSPWGSYFGAFRDKYGVEWMIEYA